jgi:hypothetical protein
MSYTCRSIQARAVPTHAEIAALAYSFWEAGGRLDGNALEHWLRAERELWRATVNSERSRLTPRYSEARRRP